MCYPSGEQSVWMLSGWQACYLSMLLQMFSSTAALSLATVCLCMRCLKSCLLTVHRALLSPATAFIPSAKLLNQCSVAQWTDLNWLIQGNMGVVTSANPTWLRKTAPQHALLYISKCKKPKENLRKLITVLENVWTLLLEQNLTDPVTSPQFPRQCPWVGSCRWQSDLVSLKHSFQGSLNSCGVRRLLCRVSGVSPEAQSKVGSNPEIRKIQNFFCYYWKLFFNPIYRQSHNSLAWLWAALREMIVSSWNHMEVGFQWFFFGAFWAFPLQKGRLLLEHDTSVSKI